MITVQKKDIAPILKNAVKVAKEKSTIKIFGHFAVSVESEVMTITASDGSRSFSESCCVAGEDVQFTINAEKLTKVINTFKSGDITIEQGRPAATVKQGRSIIKIESLNFDDFPIVPQDKADNTGMSCGDLYNAISRIQHAMAMKDVRPYLNGIHLSNGVAVATDGHRMAYEEVSYSGIDIIIPADSVSRMPHLEGDVFVSDSQLIIKGDNASFTTNLIEANFPNWKRVIPKDIELTAAFDRDVMMNAISQALISDDNATLVFSSDEIVINNESSEIVCSASCSGDGQSAFKLQYLNDALRSCDQGTVTLESGGEVRPSILNGVFVVMPVRL